jgi:predicted Zn-ribbon and HTH transcriptional regulator
MANRKGIFIGAYVPQELKDALRRRAASSYRTLSQEVTRILEEAQNAERSVLDPVTCQRCGNTWTPRTPNPQNCANPDCNSPNWHTERRRQSKAA